MNYVTTNLINWGEKGNPLEQGNIKFICNSKAFAKWSRYILAVGVLASQKMRMNDECRLICKNKRLTLLNDEMEQGLDIETSNGNENFEIDVEPKVFMRLSKLCNVIQEQPIVVAITPTNLYLFDPIYP